MYLYVTNSEVYKLIPVTKQSKARVCGRSLAGIAGPNPAGGMDISLLWQVDLCGGPVTRPEESYRLTCVSCDLVTSKVRRPWPAFGCCAREKKIVTYNRSLKSLLKYLFSLFFLSESGRLSKRITYKEVHKTSHLTEPFIPTT
jgi:hypothetical protein